MLRKITSIILYVASAFFLVTLCCISFLTIDSDLYRMAGKVLFLSFFALPAIICLFIGLAITRFKNWKRDTGTILLCASLQAIFLMLFWVCISSTPEYMPSHAKNYFQGYLTGAIVNGAIFLSGLTLTYYQKREEKATAVTSQQLADNTFE